MSPSFAHSVGKDMLLQPTRSENGDVLREICKEISKSPCFT